jgi:hypothetical protein
MVNEEIKNLNTKDKMLIAKALTDLATEIYKDNTEFILNQVLKTDNTYDSKYGKFWTRKNNAKTVQDIIEDNEKKIAKLQEDNKLLAMQKPTTIYKETSITLMSKHSQVADNIAIEMLKDIMNNLDSKRLEKSASKISKITK